MQSAKPRRPSLRLVLLTLAAATLPMALLGGCPGAKAAGPPLSAPHAGTVSGSVYVQEHKPGEEGPDPQRLTVHLPGFKIVLRDKSTGNVVSTRATDVYGRYYHSRQEPGTYVLEWEAQNGWAAGRYLEDIVILRGDEHPSPVRIEPEKGNTVILGRTLLADQGLPVLIDEFFARVETPLVSALRSDGQEFHAPVTSDYTSAYALSVSGRDLPGARVNAVSGASSATVLPTAGAFANYVHADLTFKNRAPRLVSLRARNQAAEIRRDASAGETVKAEALVEDADGHSVTVEWKGAYGPSLSPAGNDAQWKVPTKAGTYPLYAVVSDGRGGYASGQLQVSVGKTSEVFSGIVKDKFSGKAIEGALVEINGGSPQSTNANGYFLVSTPLAKRYVVNIRREGYAPACQTYDHGVQGSEFRLVVTQVETVDPTAEIVLVDKRDVLKKARLRGARLVVPPHSLEDADGNEPGGTISASFATIDIGSDEAPGDWLAQETTGESALVSYGIAYVEFYAGQTRYQLKSSAAASIEIPLNRMQPGQVPQGAPNNLLVWSYDEADGYWKPSGSADLDTAQSTYSGSVRHFSFVNMDQKGAATCIQVLIDSSLKGKILRVSDVAGDGIDYTTVKEEELDELLNAVYRIPPNQKVQLDVLASPGGTPLSEVVIERFDRDNQAQGWVLLPDHRVLAGKAISDFWPDYPYDDCPIAVTIKWRASEEVPFLIAKQAGTEAIANDYYKLVDLHDKRLNLEAWWGHNGFDANGTAPAAADEKYARTSYLNNNDLGSGRDMHFYKRSDGTVASYVSNYGNFDQNITNADRAFNQLNYGQAIATVCMEFSPLEDAAGTYIDSSGAPIAAGDTAKILEESFVKFFVFADLDGAKPGAERQTSADLDGYQNTGKTNVKFVPNLCLNCHGGNVSLDNGVLVNPKMNAFFRELDYKTYKFPFGSPVPLDPAVNPIFPDDRRAFRIQNDIVRGPSGSDPGAAISSQGIKELVDIWYRDGVADLDQDDCVNTPGTSTLDPESLPYGWNQSAEVQDIYCKIVGQSCRTCHVAFEDFRSWTTYEGFKGSEGSIKLFVTGDVVSRTMPHAIITYRNYWLSDPFRPDILNGFSWPDPISP